MYQEFAEVYDRLISSQVDYSKIADYIVKRFTSYNANPKTVLDLACGTGSLTIELAKHGYSVTALDSSAEMLNIAHEKAISENQKILFVQQDMSKFRLPVPVDAIVSTMDSLNYITSPKRLQQTFSRVYQNLTPGGVFVFDLSSPYKISEILGKNSFINEESGIFYTWECNYNKNTKISDYYLTFFLPNGEKYTRIDEVQRQRAYSSGEIKSFLSAIGFKKVRIFGNMTESPPSKRAERIFYSAQKNV